MRFGPEDAESVKKLLHLSLHEADLLKIIELAKKLNQCPPRVVIFGIEPEYAAPGCQISDTLADKISEYMTLIGKELKR